MWQPDGWGWRARIGVLTPHGDIGPEAEFRAMAPEGVPIHAARVPLGVYAPSGGKMDRTIGHGAVRAFADPPLVDEAAGLLAAALALTALGVRRVALVNPPWFSEELDRQGAAYFQGQGFEVVHSGPARLPSDQRAIHPGQLYEWVRAQTPKSADAVLIGGNGFRAVGVIQALEQDLARPVLTANQVAFWHALRLSGTHAPVVGYGQIFGREPPS